MQKKWTIEVIADFSDTSKFAFVNERVVRKAVELQALIGLVSDEQKPKVAAYAEDFFVGRDELDILAVDTPHTEEDNPPEQLSDEMLEMLGKK